MEFRNLHADEIEVFPKKITQKGMLLLLYKNARCDMNILDETVGATGWQRTHELINGNLFCNLSIWANGKWITKQDVGIESREQAQKGQASDAFKRAGFNWGIGRELYTSPLIWVNGLQGEIQATGNNKFRLDYKVKFYVSHIKTVKGIIQELEIKDHNNKVRFTFNKKTSKDMYKKDSKVNNQDKQPNSITQENKNDTEQIKGVVVDFGRYKGKTVTQIFKEDEKYVVWLSNKAKDQGVRQRAKELLKPGK